MEREMEREISDNSMRQVSVGDVRIALVALHDAAQAERNRAYASRRLGHEKGFRRYMDEAKKFDNAADRLREAIT